MEENNLIPFVAQWMTIQPSLFVCLDDELGELDEDQKTFVRVCSWTLSEQNFFQYRWCGNDRPPVSRIRIFKAFILKAVMNYPTTKLLVSTPHIHPSDIPSPGGHLARGRHADPAGCWEAGVRRCNVD